MLSNFLSMRDRVYYLERIGMNKQKCKLDEFIRTAHRYGKLNKNVEVGELSNGEFMMLQMIHFNSEMVNGVPCIGVSELAKKLNVSVPAVSRMLRSLDEKQLIARDISKDDRRTTFVYMTEEGKVARGKAQQIADDYFDGVVGRLGEEKMGTLLELWGELVDIMEEERVNRKQQKEEKKSN